MSLGTASLSGRVTPRLVGGNTSPLRVHLTGFTKAKGKVHPRKKHKHKTFKDYMEDFFSAIR